MAVSPVPDEATLILKFVFGLILVALFWPVWFGIERLWFIYKESQPVDPLPVDLSKSKGIPQKGYLEITGYPGIQVAVDSGEPVYMENLAAAAKTYRSFYFSLHPKNSPSTASVIVERKESFVTNLFGYFPKSMQEKFPFPPEKGKPVTVRGVAGYYVWKPSKEIKQYFEAGGVTVPKETILLQEGSPATLKNTLFWFIPILLLFVLGIYLFINALYWIQKVFL